MLGDIYSDNKKALYDYEILEKFEAGLVLIGQEVKSIKMGQINLAGSYVIIRVNQPELVGAKVPAYQPKNAPADYNPERSRKLLLNKKEIDYLLGKSASRGLTIIPIKVYNKNNRIKIEVAVVRKLKKHDKRESIKKRETDREVRREYKRG